jgi:hypothetical protein
MMQFSSTTLLAAATELLAESGFRSVTAESSSRWGSSNVRLFEDPYCLAAVVVYDTWQELLERWPDAQAAVVDIVSARLGKSEPKSWDVYLVLLTAAFADTLAARELNAIRYDTTRVRKLISTGEELTTLDDVKRTILPLLPVSPVSLEPPRDILEQLVDALADRGVDRDDVSRVVDAFSKNEALMPALNRGTGAA